MEWFDTWFVDWGGTDWTKDENLAHARYSEHILEMQQKKSWPGPLVTYLIAQSQIVADESGDGETYWKSIAEQEPDWIVEAGVNPAELQKVSSHIAFLQSAGGAAAAWNEALKTYAPANVAKEVIKDTAQEVEDAANPTKSWIPWAVGGVILALIAIKK